MKTPTPTQLRTLAEHITTDGVVILKDTADELAAWLLRVASAPAVGAAPIGRVVTCVYCGHQYPGGTPSSQDRALTEHIRTCAKHPLRAAEARVEKLRSALVGLVGASKREELSAMLLETLLELTPGDAGQAGGGA